MRSCTAFQVEVTRDLHGPIAPVLNVDLEVLIKGPDTATPLEGEYLLHR
jgi:hypothetical protein